MIYIADNVLGEITDFDVLGKDDIATAGLFLAQDHLDESGFSTSVRTEDCGSVMFPYDKRDRSKKLFSVELFKNVLYL